MNNFRILMSIATISLLIALLMVKVMGIVHDKEEEKDLLRSLSENCCMLETRITNLPCRGEIKDMACKCKGGWKGECECKEESSRFAAIRVDALLDHAATFSRVTAVYFRFARPDVLECQGADAREAMRVALAETREVVNKNAILFDLEFNQDVDWYFEIFRQLNKLSVTDWHEYRVWIAALTNSFDQVCKDRIRGLDGGVSSKVRLPVAAIGYRERIGMEMEAADYLRRQKTVWEKMAP